MSDATVAIRKIQEVRCQFGRLLRFRSLFRTPLERAEFERLLRAAYRAVYDAEDLLSDTFNHGDLFATDLAEDGSYDQEEVDLEP